MKNDKLKRNMKNTIMIYTSNVIESNIEIKVIIDLFAEYSAQERGTRET